MAVNLIGFRHHFRVDFMVVKWSIFGQFLRLLSRIEVAIQKYFILSLVWMKIKFKDVLFNNMKNSIELDCQPKNVLLVEIGRICLSGHVEKWGVETLAR